jgi:hypothetical protein
MQPVISVQQAVKDLRKEFVDLTNKEFHTGVARAINHTLAKGRTASNRKIRETFTITAADVRKNIRVLKATSTKLVGYVGAEGAPIPIRRFKYRPTAKGVNVEIRKGQTKHIRSAFVQTMPNGVVGVFARGRYQGKEFGFRSKRVRKKGNDLEINQLTSISTPFAFKAEEVLSAVNDTLVSSIPDRIVHELKRMRNK